MNRIEKCTLLLLALLGWYLLYLISFNPLTKDEMRYINVSQFPVIIQGFIFRYFHIYLQKLFILVSGNALEGARVFGSFCVAATTYLVYICTRQLLPQKSNLFMPLLAVGLFISSSIVLPYLGITWVDTTMMLMTMAVFALYLMLVESPKENHYGLIIMFGACLYFAMRTKECGVILGVLVIGIALSKRDAGEKAYKWVALLGIGAISGHLVMMILDGIFLDNFLFSITPSGYEKAIHIAMNLVSTTTESLSRPGAMGVPGTVPGSPSITGQTSISLPELLSGSPSLQNWLSRIVLKDIMIVASLYILGYVGLSNKKAPIYKKLPWLLPLVFLAYLTVTSGIRHWTFETRSLLPIIPLLCVFGAAYLDSFSNGLRFGREMAEKRNWIVVVALTVVSAIVVVWVANVGMNWIRGIGSVRAPEELAIGVIYPLLVCGLFVAALFAERAKLVAGLIILTITVVGGIAGPLSRTIFIYDERQQISENRFYPFTAFDKVAGFGEAERVFISESVCGEHNTIKSASKIKWMLGIVLGTNFEGKSVTVSRDMPEPLDYDIALISHSEFESAKEDEEFVESLAKNIEVYTEPRGKIVLLKRMGHLKN